MAIDLSQINLGQLMDAISQQQQTPPPPASRWSSEKERKDAERNFAMQKYAKEWIFRDCPCCRVCPTLANCCCCLDLDSSDLKKLQDAAPRPTVDCECLLTKQQPCECDCTPETNKFRLVKTAISASLFVTGLITFFAGKTEKTDIAGGGLMGGGVCFGLCWGLSEGWKCFCNNCCSCSCGCAVPPNTIRRTPVQSSQAPADQSV